MEAGICFALSHRQAGNSNRSLETRRLTNYHAFLALFGFRAVSPMRGVNLRAGQISHSHDKKYRADQLPVANPISDFFRVWIVCRKSVLVFRGFSGLVAAIQTLHFNRDQRKPLIHGLSRSPVTLHVLGTAPNTCSMLGQTNYPTQCNSRARRAILVLIRNDSGSDVTVLQHSPAVSNHHQNSTHIEHATNSPTQCISRARRAILVMTRRYFRNDVTRRHVIELSLSVSRRVVFVELNYPHFTK